MQHELAFHQPFPLQFAAPWKTQCLSPCASSRVANLTSARPWSLPARPGTMTSSQKSQLHQGGAYAFPATLIALSDDSLVTHTDLSVPIRRTVMQVLQDGRRILASGHRILKRTRWENVQAVSIGHTVKAFGTTVPGGRSGWSTTCLETVDGFSESGCSFFLGSSCTRRPHV